MSPHLLSSCRAVLDARPGPAGADRFGARPAGGPPATLRPPAARPQVRSAPRVTIKGLAAAPTRYTLSLHDPVPRAFQPAVLGYAPREEQGVAVHRRAALRRPLLPQQPVRGHAKKPATYTRHARWHLNHANLPPRRALPALLSPRASPYALPPNVSQVRARGSPARGMRLELSAPLLPFEREKLDWNDPIFSGRVVPEAPNASQHPPSPPASLRRRGEGAWQVPGRAWQVLPRRPPASPRGR